MAADFAAAVAAFKAQDYDEALRLLTSVRARRRSTVLTRAQALSDSPSNVKVLDTRAATFEKLGRPKDALRDARQICTLRPNEPRVRPVTRVDAADPAGLCPGRQDLLLRRSARQGPNDPAGRSRCGAVQQGRRASLMIVHC